jgi:uroporphyrinogen decarboxylase
MNLKFKNAILNQNHEAPPIWFMRQAGRYHSHYQALRAKNSFMDLCKIPELAAQVALGPIQDFDFDVAILFSDLLFPLEAFGMGLQYTDSGPKLEFSLTPETLKKFKSVDEAMPSLQFQQQAMQMTRELLPKGKSLVGFVGGPWTLFVYACEGTHKGDLKESKQKLEFYPQYLEKMLPLLKKNIALQLAGGAEIIYLFDTAAGELTPEQFKKFIEPGLIELSMAYPGQLAYYSKATTPFQFSKPMSTAGWAGFGFDHNVNLAEQLQKPTTPGFIQGNFNQNFLLQEFSEFKPEFEKFQAQFTNLLDGERSRWVCGLGHGVLPKTPEKNVKYFVESMRKAFE